MSQIQTQNDDTINELYIDTKMQDESIMEESSESQSDRPANQFKNLGDKSKGSSSSLLVKNIKGAIKRRASKLLGIRFESNLTPSSS